MNLFELVIQKLQQIVAPFVSLGSFFSLPQLVVAFLIAAAYLAYRQMRRHGAVRLSVIFQAMLWRRFIFNRSTYADLFYFLLNTFVTVGLIGWGIFSALAVSDLSVRALRTAFGVSAASTAPEWGLRAGITLVAFLGYELGYYIDHYLKHKIPVLWEFHKTHHTAEILTPLTVFRVHPIDSLIFVDITAISIGILHGMFIYLVGKSVNIYSIDNTNIIMAVFYFLVAHLQHSQFWIPLTGLPGRILLSPAHHQIHHSADPAYYNRNLGSFLAIWDWLFGTLSIPQRASQRLKFGVSQGGDDPHRIMTLLIAPFTNALAVLGLGRRPAAHDEPTPLPLEAAGQG